jgi:protein O-GlcNAc transferase
MGHPRARANLQREAARRDVDPARLIDAPRVAGNANHLARLQCADLFLDTTPYNAHTTCSDALWMGLPVVTCVGETFPSRVGGSLLTGIDAPELITYDLEAYHQRALELATDRARLATLRERITTSRDTAPMFDARTFARDLESLYAQAWRNPEGRAGGVARHLPQRDSK